MTRRAASLVTSRLPETGVIWNGPSAGTVDTIENDTSWNEISVSASDTGTVPTTVPTTVVINHLRPVRDIVHTY